MRNSPNEVEDAGEACMIVMGGISIIAIILILLTFGC